MTATYVVTCGQMTLTKMAGIASLALAMTEEEARNDRGRLAITEREARNDRGRLAITERVPHDEKK